MEWAIGMGKLRLTIVSRAYVRGAVRYDPLRPRASNPSLSKGDRSVWDYGKATVDNPESLSKWLRTSTYEEDRLERLWKSSEEKKSLKRKALTGRRKGKKSRKPA